METTAKEIIDYVEKNYPSQEQVKLVNIADYKIETGQRHLTQIILGVTKQDHINADIEQYRFNMGNQLRDISDKYKCTGWGYKRYDIQQMKAVLKEVAEYLDIETDTEKMVGRLARIEEERIYFIVVTAVQYDIAYVQ